MSVKVNSLDAPFKCIGVIGFLFGHQFKKGWLVTYDWDHCFRCGMPSGRWEGKVNEG